jgi:hypothetical protein
MYPTDYIKELKQKGKRAKAMAFMDYLDDMQTDIINSFGFYAKAWGVSKSTAHSWISEFRVEIDRFFNYWSLKNNTHYSSVKNASERQPNDLKTFNASQNTDNREFSESSRTVAERQPNKEFNIYDDDKRAKAREAEDLYFIYRLNTKFAGKREDAIKEYLKIDSNIKYKDIMLAAMLYLRDKTVSKKFNLKNFLRNKVFLNYLEVTISIFKDGEWIEGKYNSNNEILFQSP